MRHRVTARPWPGGMLLPALLPLAVIAFLVLGVGSNALLALLSLAIFVAASCLLWRPGEPPILLFIFGYAWLQASAAIFHANWLQLDLATYAEIPGSIETAIVLSLIGLFCLAMGMRVGAGPVRPEYALSARALASSVPILRFVRIYVLVSVISVLALTFTWAIPGLSQPLIALASLKWVPFFMLAYASLAAARASKVYWLIAFLFEFGQGFGGFFADFKTVIYFSVLAAIAAGTRLTGSQVIGLSSAIALALAAGIVWSSIKGDYRAFVSDESGAQVVLVDFPTRTVKIAELVSALDEDRLTEGAHALARRIAYVEFFGAVIDFVPRSLPHENGAITWDAISRPFMPRILFPGKAAIDDTERTNLYTGGLAGTSEGTSISLGYIAEVYIDFGPYLMMPILFLAGVLYGRIYASFAYHPASGGLLGMAMATAILFVGFALESSMTKIFGGICVTWLVATIVVKWVVPVWFRDLMCKPTR